MCTGKTGNGLRILVDEVPLADFIGEELEQQVLKKSAKEQLLKLDLDQTYDAEFAERLGQHLALHIPMLQM